MIGAMSGVHEVSMTMRTGKMVLVERRDAMQAGCRRAKVGLTIARGAWGKPIQSRGRRQWYVEILTRETVGDQPSEASLHPHEPRRRFFGRDLQ